MIATATEAAGLLPPAPEHVSENVVGAVRAPELRVPLAASVPLQPPDAAHEAAFVELQVRVDAAPLVTDVGLAVSVAVGIRLTVTLVAWLVPPAPVQINENVAGACSGPELRLPLAGSVPLQLPEAVQEVALVELHVRVDESPLFTAVRDALTEAVGTGVLPDPPHEVNNTAAMMPVPAAENRTASPRCIFTHPTTSVVGR